MHGINCKGLPCRPFHVAYSACIYLESCLIIYVIIQCKASACGYSLEIVLPNPSFQDMEFVIVVIVPVMSFTQESYAIVSY